MDVGLGAGILGLEDLRRAPSLGELLDEIDARYPGLEPPRRIHELTRRVITRFVEDVVAEGERRLADAAPRHADDVRRAGRTMICFSDRLNEADTSIKRFLYANMYRHPKVMEVRREADGVVRDLFARFMTEPGAMPEEWQAGLPQDEPRLARRVADYIAGMTDRYALLEHRRLFGATPDLR